MTDEFYNGGKATQGGADLPTNFDLVGNFMQTFEQEVLTTPQFPSDKICQLRVDLIAEELQELKDAIADRNVVEVADALTDLLYVVYGAGHAFGVELDLCFNEVHNSNMSKLDENGKVLKREDGKVLKSDRYWRPNLHKVLGLENTDD